MENEKVEAEAVVEHPPIFGPVDDTVVDWNRHVQVNPKTGQEFDFNGKLIEPVKPKAASASIKPPKEGTK